MNWEEFDNINWYVTCNSTPKTRIGHARNKRSPVRLAYLISHQPAVFFSHNKPATSNQPTVLFSQNKSAPATSHQPNEQTESFKKWKTDRYTL
jgi:hypothetical protein